MSEMIFIQSKNRDICDMLNDLRRGIPHLILGPEAAGEVSQLDALDFALQHFLRSPKNQKKAFAHKWKRCNLREVPKELRKDMGLGPNGPAGIFPEGTWTPEDPSDG